MAYTQIALPQAIDLVQRTNQWSDEDVAGAASNAGLPQEFCISLKRVREIKQWMPVQPGEHLQLAVAYYLLNGWDGVPGGGPEGLARCLQTR